MFFQVKLDFISQVKAAALLTTIAFLKTNTVRIS